MTKVIDILNYLNELAPLELQMGFDNSGFLVGHAEAPVTKAITALDITDDVINEAIEAGAELIVSHHPLIFTAPKKITDGDSTGSKVLKMAENHIAAICMHTNLDIAEGGVNDILLNVLGADRIDVLDEEGCGRVGIMREEISMNLFLERCKNALSANGLRYISSGKCVKKLAVMGGSGADAIEQAFLKGCDTYVTSDIKYHQFQKAQELGLNLIDADHFCTENPVIPVITDNLSENFKEVVFSVSKRHKPLIQFF